MKRRISKWVVPAMVMWVVFFSAGVTAQQEPGDSRIVAAREAFRTGDRNTLVRLAGQADAHPLDAYVEYWLLLNALAASAPPPLADIDAFLKRHTHTVVAERLRMAWLKRMANQNQWTDFLREYPALSRPDEELRCLAWQARLATGDPKLAAEVSAAWLSLVNNHAACDEVLSRLALRGDLSQDQVWWRFRRQIDSRTPERARATASWLPAQIAPARASLDQALKAPAAYLDRLPPSFATTRPGRELALVALTRVAREDPDAAYVRLLRIGGKLTNEEKTYAYSMLGHHGALSRLPMAADWFAAAGDLPLSPEKRAWRVRAALRVERWPEVEQYIGRLPESERNQPEWIYWLGRAHAAQGREAAAQALYRSLAGETHFYALLANEELGNLFVPPATERLATPADKARVASDSGLTRALALYRLEMQTEAIREWAWAVRGKDDAFLSAAASLALERGLYDRAINTAELGSANANFDLRFITPYRELIEPQVKAQDLDLAWVYGLMRQESRFIAPARSSAGAQGLMQVMPATGKWVANKIGMTHYSPSMLSDPKTNVLLGTSYMRIIMSDLDSHPVLASAGYNAGPGRASRWRDRKPLEGAIYTETIPFDETRDYVKKVLSNAVIYAAIFEQKPQSLKARLGVIAPSYNAP